ncbi:MAG: AMP-binding protein [Lachnospiraceae bacterium]|nr:AMP-binding protein [Lachnospiraceae bacterium]
MSTIAKLWNNSVEKFADYPAVRWLVKKDVMEMSYKELGENIEAVKNGLCAKGYSGAHISLIGPSSVYWVQSYLAIVTGDNVAVPLDVNLPAENLVELINRADVQAVFLDPKQSALLDEIKKSCPGVKDVWFLDDEYENGQNLSDLKNAGAGANPGSSSGEDIATIIFTSGTTGVSKGVMLTQSNLYTNVESVQFEKEPGCVMMSVLPIHHAFCLVMDWLKGFSLGATVCINDSFMHMVRNMSIFKPEVMLMVPLMIETIYKKLAATDASVPPEMIAQSVFGGNLKIIFTGGAHLEPFYIDEFAKYGVDVLEGYGMSECSPVITSNTPDNHKPGSIGRPLPNVEIKFEDGQILVKGSSVMKGYYKMPEETEETLADGWLHTGDKGYMDEDGYVFINGRVKNLIILSNGENISPEEMENKLALFEMTAEVVVIGENNGLTAIIYPEVELAKAKGMDDDAVRESIQKSIDEFNLTQPTYRRITGLSIRKNPFVRNTTGKIIRANATDEMDA